MITMILLYVACFMVTFGVISTVNKVARRDRYSLWIEVIMVSIGMTYILWFCN